MRDSVIKYCRKITAKSQITTSKFIKMLGIRRSKYYDWNKRYGLVNHHNGKMSKSHWITPEERKAVIDFATDYICDNSYYLHDGYRRITYTMIDKNICAVSTSSVYRILKKAGLLNRWKNKRTNSKGGGYNQPTAPYQEWHTDIKYVNYRGTFLFFISILDGYSRYIIHHELRASMTEYDVEIVLQRALEKHHGDKPKIISDNGSQYISKDFQVYLKEVGLKHIRTSPSYPQSNGKIERFHRTLEEECLRTKSMINIKDAKMQIDRYVDHYNNHRLHSSLFYLRPVDFLNGDVDELLKIRQSKLDEAVKNRVKYWKNINNVA